MKHKRCLSCQKRFSHEIRLEPVPDICRVCWNFARVEFHHFKLLVGNFIDSAYPAGGGCPEGTCRSCDGDEDERRHM